MATINKVELVGFKSFRKRTVIPFFDGVTAVVGERCDQLRHGPPLLAAPRRPVRAPDIQRRGEIRPGRQRRGNPLPGERRADRLEHLIFNGGEKYDPADSAEVTLYLENDGRFDRFLEDGQSAPEVTIGRRITRRSSTYRRRSIPTANS